MQYRGNYGFNSQEQYDPYAESVRNMQKVQQQQVAVPDASGAAAAGAMSGVGSAGLTAGVGYLMAMQQQKRQEEEKRRESAQAALQMDHTMRQQALGDIMKAYSAGLMR